MNWPFLIEPYNTWQKPPKKKHWMEIAEEEALFHRMMQEARMQEAKEQQSAQQVQDGSPAAAAAAAGAGGQLFPSYYSELVEVADFSTSTDRVGGPLSVSFTNLTTTPENDTFLWNLGNETTSTAINPSSFGYGTGSYTIILQATSSEGNKTSKTSTLVVPTPTVVSSFTFSPTTGSAPLNLTFSNASTTDNNFPLTYRWTLGSGSATTQLSTATNSTCSYTAPGSYTIRLSVTESAYNSASVSTKLVLVT